MTGTSARGGGVWKYILQADTNQGLMRRGHPIMSQALHFLDFSLTPKQLQAWREEGLRGRYNTQFASSLNYQAPIFLDSGGYQLLWNDTLDLSSYGLCVKRKQGPKNILSLQRDLGGDIVATLDYPLPPGLNPAEAKKRMKKSSDNAVATAELLQKKDNAYRPFLHIAAHGQDRDSISHYVQSVLQKLKKKELTSYPFGLAVGSLVPLRMSSNHVAVANIVMGLREGMQDLNAECRASIPIHAFGVCGTLIPLLSYLGVDSFDSSTYVQKGRNLTYVHPDTYRDQRILEIDELTCQCNVCREVNLSDMHHALLSEVKNRPQRCGHYKSKYYADICLHNLEMDFRVVARTRDAIKANEIREFLIEHAERFPVLKPAVDTVAIDDSALRRRISRVSSAVPQSSFKKTACSKVSPQIPEADSGLPAAKRNASTLNPSNRVISLDRSPADFDITSNGYKPPAHKSVLLIVPCSESKPYGNSRTHQYLISKLSASLGDRLQIVHKVTLSGLYGPVPEENENEAPILTYDFRLDAAHTKQIALVANRLATYIRRHKDRYGLHLGYATTLAYRIVLEQAADLLRRDEQSQDGIGINFRVLPIKPKVRRLTEFFRAKNINELVAIVSQFDLEQQTLVQRKRQG